jgi:hypothetical protein
MFRPTVRLAQREFVRRTARYCDSPWFRLAVVMLLTCLLLPVPRARAEVGHSAALSPPAAWSLIKATQSSDLRPYQSRSGHTFLHRHPDADRSRASRTTVRLISLSG